MDDRDLTEAYQDVMQNLEFAIVRVYREHPDLTDAQVRLALDKLIRAYRAEERGYTVRPPRASLTQEVFVSVKSMADWRLGKEQEPSLDEDGNPVDLPIQPITREELERCLRRILKSIKLWTEQSGRQGYLNYVSQFLP